MKQKYIGMIGAAVAFLAGIAWWLTLFREPRVDTARGEIPAHRSSRAREMTDQPFTAAELLVRPATMARDDVRQSMEGLEKLSMEGESVSGTDALHLMQAIQAGRPTGISAPEWQVNGDGPRFS